ncbi:hypothetical protein [Gordonia sp. YY1]|uniref:hypothetical protein n=1 Tax=Gordonia sp. YY1 TaxID=396712 RepID=UPI0013314B04|nr:hypothetical protein [Gordonia sp. YY1]KAF0968312.1 hypothetical protein BPODLACK_03253 [Gordonia sp. YY1]
MSATYRRIELLRGTWGTVLLVGPRGVMRALGVHVDTSSIVVARILGARHIIQAASSGVNPSPEVLAVGVWVDAVHAATAIGLAAADTKRAHAGLLDALVAGIWAASGYRDLARARATPQRHQRVRDQWARDVLSVVPGGRTLLGRVDQDRHLGHDR